MLASPATAEPAEAADDGSVATQWIGPTAAAAMPRRPRPGQGAWRRHGRARAGDDVRAPPGNAPKGVTKPTRSAGERVEASVDGSRWRLVATVTAPTLHDVVAGDGLPARYVRLVALGATPAVPLIVGELGVQS